MFGSRRKNIETIRIVLTHQGRPFWFAGSCNTSSSNTTQPRYRLLHTSLGLVGVRDLPLRDMISLGAWRMGLGCPGKILPSPPPSSPPPSPPSLTRIWDMGSYRFSLRLQRFRSARIDPSSLLRSTDARILLFFLVGKNQKSENNQKRSKIGKKKA